ncbi:hypothetical protein COV18_01270 [Candidatus Woesearchaeota archaeon CG10_big_fil_rev_8_21_14_0_10_37_12]|nr:MAG: hypothetical protein COV18_01270 [Candidatus Woesearchaeota archaeon CG10_big_fil_rev_8_21_14_0_10_37_12]
MKYRTLTLCLTIFGILLTSYLTYAHITASTLPCPANGTAGCDTIIASHYAKLLGIPVAMYGLAAYLLIFFLAWKKKTRYVSYVGLIGVFAAGYFNWIMFGVLQQICLWCEASHLTMSLLFLTNAPWKWSRTLVLFVLAPTFGVLISVLIA